MLMTQFRVASGSWQATRGFAEPRRSHRRCQVHPDRVCARECLSVAPRARSHSATDQVFPVVLELGRVLEGVLVGVDIALSLPSALCKKIDEGSTHYVALAHAEEAADADDDAGDRLAVVDDEILDSRRFRSGCCRGSCRRAWTRVTSAGLAVDEFDLGGRACQPWSAACVAAGAGSRRRPAAASSVWSGHRRAAARLVLGERGPASRAAARVVARSVFHGFASVMWEGSSRRDGTARIRVRGPMDEGTQ